MQTHPVTKNRTNRTNRANENEELCKFQFAIHFNTECKHWCFFKKGLGNKQHIGHMQLLPEEVKARASLIDKNELEIICDSLSLLTPKDAIRAPLTRRTNVSITTRQLQTINRSIQSTVMMTGRKTTPAKRSMQNLKSDENTSYCAL